MTTKLNLTIEEDTARKIKLYAERKQTSVSKIAEAYFKTLTNKKSTAKSFVEKYAGTIKDLKIDDIDKAREEYLREKYGI